jgi:MFS family permease
MRTCTCACACARAQRRLGGPAWLACISIAWGAAAAACALVRGPASFVGLRLLLGLAESGALPGTWFYISCWYPADRTTIPYTIVETGARARWAGLAVCACVCARLSTRWQRAVAGALPTCPHWFAHR